MTGEEAILIMTGSDSGGSTYEGRKYCTGISIVKEEPINISDYSFTGKVAATIKIIKYGSDIMGGGENVYLLDVYPSCDSDASKIRLYTKESVYPYTESTKIDFYNFYPT